MSLPRRDPPLTAAELERVHMLRAAGIVDSSLRRQTPPQNTLGVSVDILVALATQGRNPAVAIADALKRMKVAESESESESSEEEIEREPLHKKVYCTCARVDHRPSSGYKTPVSFESELRPFLNPKTGSVKPSETSPAVTKKPWVSPLATTSSRSKAAAHKNRHHRRSCYYHRHHHHDHESETEEETKRPRAGSASSTDNPPPGGGSPTGAKHARKPSVGVASTAPPTTASSSNASTPSFKQKVEKGELYIKLSNGHTKCRLQTSVSSIDMLTLSEVQQLALDNGLIPEDVEGSTIRVEYIDGDGDRIRCTLDDDLASVPVRVVNKVQEATLHVNVEVKHASPRDPLVRPENPLGMLDDDDIVIRQRSASAVDSHPPPRGRSIYSSDSESPYKRSVSQATIRRSESAFGVRLVREAVKGGFLGAGSYGRVFAGIDVDTGTPVAIKEVTLNVPPSALMQSPNASPVRAITSPISSVDSSQVLFDLDSLSRMDPGLKALQREISVLASLDHQNIIRYLGMTFAEHTSPSSAYIGGAKKRASSASVLIFMEQATSGSLKKVMDEFGALPEPLVARYTRDMLRGLAYLHSKSILHRDIKPANVLLSNGIAKLADFGCSKLQPVAAANVEDVVDPTGTLERSLPQGDHTMAGTVSYMAPEILTAALELTQEESGGSSGAYHRRARRGKHRAASSSRSSGSADEGAAALPPRAQPHNPHADIKIKNVYGWASDVWAIGITVLEMVSGKSLFSSGWPSVIKLVVDKRSPGIPEHLSEPAKDFLSKCLAYDPADRWTAEQLLQHPFLQNIVSTDDAGLTSPTPSNATVASSTIGSLHGRSIDGGLEPKSADASMMGGTLLSWSVSSGEHAATMASKLTDNRPFSGISSTTEEEHRFSASDDFSVPQTATWQREHLERLRKEAAKAGAK